MDDKNEFQILFHGGVRGWRSFVFHLLLIAFIFKRLKQDAPCSRG